MKYVLSVFVAMLFALAGSAPAQAEPVTPIDAAAFIDSQGVNVHLGFNDTVYYSNFSMVKQRLRELGIRHVRDGFMYGDRSDLYPRYADMAANGFRGTMINCRFIKGATDKDDWEHFTAIAKRDDVRPFIEALEGVNEPDQFDGGNHDGGSWWNDARGCDFYTHKYANDSTYGASLNVPTYMSSPGGHGKHKDMGNLWEPKHADGGNYHPYPGEQKPSGPVGWEFDKVMGNIRAHNFMGVQVPVIATETGYHNALKHTGGHRPVSERASGIYLPRLFLEYARGAEPNFTGQPAVKRTFLYELVDLKPDDGTKSDAQRHFGLYRNDWTPKPAATVISRMNTLLASPPGPRTPLDITMSNTADPDGAGTKGDVRHLLMQKADGKYMLAVWQNSTVWQNGADVANDYVLARVNLPQAMSVLCHRPATGSTCGSISSSTGFSVRAHDDLLLIELAKR